MRIRAARAADIGAMHALRLSVRENRLSDAARITEESYLPHVAASSAWIAETGEGPAGFAVLDAGAGSVWALFVAPEAEGRGVGRALLSRLVESAAESGLARLRLTTAPGTRAERFYREAGWSRIGETKDGELEFERVLAR